MKFDMSCLNAAQIWPIGSPFLFKRALKSASRFEQGRAIVLCMISRHELSGPKSGIVHTVRASKQYWIYGPRRAEAACARARAASHQEAGRLLWSVRRAHHVRLRSEPRMRAGRVSPDRGKGGNVYRSGGPLEVLAMRGERRGRGGRCGDSEDSRKGVTPVTLG
jgi:hypothetical protein